MDPAFEAEVNLDILDLMVTAVRTKKDERKKKTTNLFVHRENSISSTNLEMPSMVERDAVSFFTSLGRLLEQEKMSIEDFCSDYMPKYEDEEEHDESSPQDGHGHGQHDSAHDRGVPGWGNYDDDGTLPIPKKASKSRVGFNTEEETPAH